MPSRKRTVEIEVVVDDKDARRNLQNIEGNTRKTGKAFSTMGTLVKAGLAAFGSREMIQAFVAMDKLNTQMAANEQRANVVFGNMADDVRRWADEQNEAFGIGENALLGLASNMQDLLIPMGFAREEATELTKETLRVANALDDWKGGTLGVENATEKIIKAMLKEREGLVELGIKISDADVKQRLLEKGQQDLTGEALAQAEALATLELIMDKSTDALTAYEDRASSAVATQKELNASVEDSRETWSQIFQPAIESSKRTLVDLSVIAKGVSGDIEGLTESSESAGGSFDFLRETALDLIIPARLLGEGIHALADLFRDNETAAANAASQLTDTEKRAREAFAAISKAAKEEMGETEDAINDARGAVERLSGAVTRARIIFGAGRTDSSFVVGDDPLAGRFPNRHQGGTVPGTPGTDQLIMAQAGEHVTRRAEANGHGGSVIVNVHGSLLGENQLLRALQERNLIRARYSPR